MQIHIEKGRSDALHTGPFFDLLSVLRGWTGKTIIVSDIFFLRGMKPSHRNIGGRGGGGLMKSIDASIVRTRDEKEPAGGDTIGVMRAVRGKSKAEAPSVLVLPETDADLPAQIPL